jgi:cysteine desulfurase
MTDMPAQQVYLDFAATTPVDTRVQKAMQPYFGLEFGNPSSVHGWGQRAHAAVEQARQSVARSLGCRPDEILFTACGSESDNLALRGAALAERQRRGATHILTTPVEHHAVLRTAQQLAEHFGFELELLPVDAHGMVAPQVLASHLRPETAIVSIIHANNEIGSINPIAELSAVCRQSGIPFHTDAVQAASHLALNLTDLGVDLLSIGAHKFYGPKGVGALYVRHGVALIPTLTGGEQEFGLRAGTHNVPLIVGLAEALRIAVEERQEHVAHTQELRDYLISNVLQRIPDSSLTGHPQQRLPNHASFVFDGVAGDLLLAALDLAGFACSSGSACKSGESTPSEVLLAIGVPHHLAASSLRVTLGRTTTREEIDLFLAALQEAVQRLRAAAAGEEG